MNDPGEYGDLDKVVETIATPETDALDEAIERRRVLRGFHMPEDVGDALVLCGKLERKLAEANRKLAVGEGLPMPPPLVEIVEIDRRLLLDKVIEACASGIHYLEEHYKLDLSTAKAADVNAVLDGWKGRYFVDAVFNARVKTLAHMVIGAVNHCEEDARKRAAFAARPQGDV